jgi:hypothetical protein
MMYRGTLYRMTTRPCRSKRLTAPERRALKIARDRRKQQRREHNLAAKIERNLSL